MRAGPILCPFCNERVPRAAIRCVYCNTWLAVGIFRAESGDRAPAPVAGAFGRVIYLTPADFAKLEYAATIERNPRSDPLARALIDKLGHAVVMSARDIPNGVLTVGGSARIAVSDGATRRERLVTLRHPGEEDGAGDEISVLSPMGFALLGLVAGESAIYRGPDGRSHTATVEQVLGAPEYANAARVPSFSPQSGGDDDPGPAAA
jgi:regulator of nucleoside diphosphate kinase